MVNPKLQPQSLSPNRNRTFGNGQDSIGLSKHIDQIDPARYGLQICIAGTPEDFVFVRVDWHNLVTDL